MPSKNTKGKLNYDSKILRDEKLINKLLTYVNFY